MADPAAATITQLKNIQSRTGKSIAELQDAQTAVQAAHRTHSFSMTWATVLSSSRWVVGLQAESRVDWAPPREAAFDVHG